MSFKACAVFLSDSPRLTLYVRHRDMTCALCFVNLRDEAFFGRVVISNLKKSITNSR